MPYPRRKSYGKPQMTRQQHFTEMKMFLSGCRDEALSSTSADDLVKRYKVSASVAESELREAKGRRNVD